MTHKNMAEQLQSIKRGLGMKERSKSFREPSKKRKRVTKSNQVRLTYPFKLQQKSALAIASNQAQSRALEIIGAVQQLTQGQKIDPVAQLSPPFAAGILKQLSDLHNTHKDDSLTPEQKQQRSDAIRADNEKIEPIYNQCLLIWRYITTNVKDTSNLLYHRDEKVFIVYELLNLLNDLRNYFSHGKTGDIPVDVSGKRKMTDFLLKLGRYAITNERYTQPLILVKEHPSGDTQKSASWAIEPDGIVLLLSLLLTKTQMHRALSQLDSGHKRSYKNLMSFYCHRPGMVLLEQEHGKEMLAREILGYLALPPIDSKEGQQRFQDVLETSERQREEARHSKPKNTTQTYQITDNTFNKGETTSFRRESKVRDYLLRIIDELNLLPMFSFYGYQQTNIGSEQEPIWQTAEEEKQFEQFQGKSKAYRLESYGRNSIRDAKQRFVYLHKDNNIRFQINHVQTTYRCYMRLRDFISMLYLHIEQHQEFHLTELDIVQGIAQWIDSYHHNLEILAQNDEVDVSQFDRKLHKDLPDKLARRAQGKEQESLFEKIDRKLAFKKQRIEFLNKAFDANKTIVTAKQRLPRVSKQDARVAHDHFHQVLSERKQQQLSLQTQVFEVIECLNGELTADKKLSKQEFKRWQVDVLQFDDVKARERFFELLKDKHSDFYQHHETSNNSLQTLSVDFASLKKATSLHQLCSVCLDFINEKQRWAEQVLHDNKENETALVQLAARMQIASQKQQSGIDASEPHQPLQTSYHNAKAFTVLPKAFFQTLKGLKEPEHSKRKGKPRNIAHRIRDAECRLPLNIAFYDSHLALPDVAKRISDYYEQGRDSGLLQTGDKARWRKSLDTLSTWHVEDAILALLTEKVLQTMNIIIPDTLKELTEVFSTSTTRKVRGRVIRYRAAKHVYKQWAQLSRTKLERLIEHNTQKGDTIEAETILQWQNQYYKKQFEFINALLEFESQYDQKSHLQFSTNAQGAFSYLSFRTLLDHLVKSKILTDEESTQLRMARNIALHDGIPEQLIAQAFLQEKAIIDGLIQKYCPKNIKKTNKKHYKSKR